MIPRMHWGNAVRPGPSPFVRGRDERPLRVTFDVANLAHLDADDAAALRLLRDLARYPEIEVYATEPGWGGHFTVSAVVEDDMRTVEFRMPDGSTGLTGVRGVRRLSRAVAHHIGHPVIEPVEPALRRAIEDVVVAEAHHAVGADLLVTGSPTLLRSPGTGVAAQANARGLADAAALFGLFLRSREVYGDGVRSYGRARFYWVLMRHWTPAFWRYFGACVYAAKVRGEDAMDLGGSLLDRCVRALEARDAVGIAFYSIPTLPAATQRVLYHFDYLTVVLAGALDVMARVARLAYGLTLQERFASFRNQQFRRELAANGGQTLLDIVTGQFAEDVTTLLLEPRNAIHGAAWRAWSAHANATRDDAFVTIPPGLVQAIDDAAGRLGGDGRWGLVTAGQVRMLDPYTYACALCVAAFRLFNAIADATMVEKLFGAHPVPPLRTSAPHGGVFDPALGARLAILSGPGP